MAEEREGRSRLPHSWSESNRFVPTTFVQPTLRFLRQGSAGGAVMLAAAVIAVAWANSPASDSYFGLFGTTIEIAFGDFHFHHLSELTVREWINDGAMVVFFFVVGLEIKREVVVGDLRDPKTAALPAIAALGGMLVPAGIYLLFNRVLLAGPGAEPGAWGIPMATDIAFAVGIVAMLGRRVPVSAKLFLLALAIVDDLGAIIVIALIYTDQLYVGWLLAAAAGLCGIALMNRLDVRAPSVFVIAGSLVWLAMLESGVHATLAGVAVAMLTPVTSFLDPRRFDDHARPLVEKVSQYVPDEVPLHRTDHHTIARVGTIIEDLRRLSYETLPPLSRLELKLAPVSSFLIVPTFALANAGVRIEGDAIRGALDDPVLLGVALGLIIGKTVGVTGFAFAAVRLGLGRMPQGTTWRHILGIGMLSGIGFTVALFVASLSLAGPALDSAKIGIFAGSLLAGGGGYLFLRAGDVRAEPGDPDEPPGAGKQSDVLNRATA